MYDFMCMVWQLVGSVVGLLILMGLIIGAINSFGKEEGSEDDD